MCLCFCKWGQLFVNAFLKCVFLSRLWMVCESLLSLFYFILFYWSYSHIDLFFGAQVYKFQHIHVDSCNPEFIWIHLNALWVHGNAITLKGPIRFLLFSFRVLKTHPCPVLCLHLWYQQLSRPHGAPPRLPAHSPREGIRAASSSPNHRQLWDE